MECFPEIPASAKSECQTNRISSIPLMPVPCAPTCCLNDVLFLLRCGIIAVLCGWPCSGFGHGAYHDVVKELTEALAKNPGDAEAHFRLARAHQEHGECALALRELERVDQIAPGKFPTQLVQGLALSSGGLWTHARATFDRVLAEEPMHAEALAARAVALLHLRESAAAIADRRKALTLTPRPGAEFFTSWVELLRKHGEAAEALHMAREGLKLCVDDPSLLILSIDLEVEAGEYDAALGRLAALEKNWPRREPWMKRRAEILTLAGRPEEARSAWQALREHLLALPNLERATPFLTEMLGHAERGLGIASPTPVIAPPAPAANP